jgi:hypothetical protein
MDVDLTEKRRRDSCLKYAAGVDIDSPRHSIRRQIKQLLAVTTPNAVVPPVFTQPWPVFVPPHTQITRRCSPDAEMGSY